MKKSALASTVALLTVGLLTGCAGGGDTDPTPTPTETPRAETPSMKVPETATGSSASLMVNGGSLEKGTRATIYRFGGGWDGAPVTCDDPKAETREVTLTGDGSDQVVPFPVTPGVVSWVLVAGDYTTPCDEDGSRTRVLVGTDVDVFPSEAPTVGQPVTIKLTGNTLPETVPATATVDVLGPWANLPQSAAADCATATVSDSSTVEMAKEAGRTVYTFDTAFTPTEPGVYRVVLDVPETEQSTALNTCEDGSKAVTFVVAGQ